MELPEQFVQLVDGLTQYVEGNLTGWPADEAAVCRDWMAPLIKFLVCLEDQAVVKGVLTTLMANHLLLLMVGISTWPSQASVAERLKGSPLSPVLAGHAEYFRCKLPMRTLVPDAPVPPDTKLVN